MTYNAWCFDEETDDDSDIPDIGIDKQGLDNSQIKVNTGFDPEAD